MVLLWYSQESSLALQMRSGNDTGIVTGDSTSLTGGALRFPS